MVRDKRRRYVIVEVEGGLSQRKLVDYLRSFKGGSELWLIYYDGKRAIIRTDHRSKERAVEYLNVEPNSANGNGKTTLRTIGVTGTIKKARMKYFGGIPIPRGPRRSPSGDRKRRGRKRR